jgi:hypothetical protein
MTAGVLYLPASCWREDAAEVKRRTSTIQFLLANFIGLSVLARQTLLARFFCTHGRYVYVPVGLRTVV